MKDGVRKGEGKRRSEERRKNNERCYKTRSTISTACTSPTPNLLCPYQNRFHPVLSFSLINHFKFASLHPEIFPNYVNIVPVW